MLTIFLSTLGVGVAYVLFKLGQEHGVQLFNPFNK